ncbi:MAG: type II 3-dehydroquinate dehydratase [Candidatus Caenarcaniphilales bacterium]|nr:type II 3-dehydroquinate dehydratase [Candidatus Caenarcaniphilales bacterium]
MFNQRKIRVIHGPNLNLLGIREPETYGDQNLTKINSFIIQKADQLGVQVDFKQSNHEGEILDFIHEARVLHGLIINPGAYTHTSIAIRDAIQGTGVRAIEVHLSNVFARESFRHNSCIAPVCIGQVCGFGAFGYLMALEALYYLETQHNNSSK